MRLDDPIIFDADIEEPNCGICDHANDGEALCIKGCGPEHGWNRYRRTTSWRQLLNEFKRIIEEGTQPVCQKK